MMSKPKVSFSYPKNVEFRCTRCTSCCGDTETKARHILLLNKEAGGISKAVSKSIETFAYRIEGHEPYVFEMMKAEDGKCLFLKGNACAIYRSRPLICRYYPFELEPAKNRKYVFSFTSECPGIGKGKLLGRAYFQKLLQHASDQLG